MKLSFSAEYYELIVPLYLALTLSSETLTLFGGSTKGETEKNP